jgi:hypothetical protein
VKAPHHLAIITNKVWREPWRLPGGILAVIRADQED